MTVYNINRGIGWASSGVEYAQAYRANLLRRLGVPIKFIFTDMFRMENIEHMTKNIGFEDDEIIWLYSYFTDYTIEPSTYPLTKLEESFDGAPSSVEREKKSVRYRFEDRGMYAVAYLRDGHDDIVQRVEYVCGGKLVRKDYFTSGRLFSEYYAPVNNEAHLYLRRFFNRDGTEALCEIMDGETDIYRVGCRSFFSKPRFIAYFISCLGLTEDDVLIIDRATEIGQAVLNEHGKCRIGSVVHAEHYNEKHTDDDNILWNNYYEYEFTHADRLDFLVTSTDAQNVILTEQLEKYQGMHTHIVTIPVGSLNELKRPEGARRKHSMITASRLADEKHIDWLVKAAVIAREKVPDISLDIYGMGGEEQALRSLIKELGAEEYIRMMGHHHLENVYRDYECYAAGSTSEGFGLTLMEAVGSGLAMIGFDVHYGNQTFIDPGKNGILIPYDASESVQRKVALLADAMVKLFTEMDMEGCASRSYEMAEEYLTDRIVERWRKLILGEAGESAAQEV